MNFRKLISVEMTCSWFVFCLLMASWRKHQNDESRLAQKNAFVFRNWAFLCYYTAQPCFLINTSLSKTALLFHFLFLITKLGLFQHITSGICVFKSPLTPNNKVSRCLVNAPGVACHASVGPGIRDVWRRDEQAAWFEQGEPGQLDWTAG